MAEDESGENLDHHAGSLQAIRNYARTHDIQWGSVFVSETRDLSPKKLVLAALNNKGWSKGFRWLFLIENGKWIDKP